MKKDIIVIEGTLLGPEEGVTYDGGPTKYQRALDRIEKLQAQVDVMREALRIAKDALNEIQYLPEPNDDQAIFFAVRALEQIDEVLK